MQSRADHLWKMAWYMTGLDNCPLVVVRERHRLRSVRKTMTRRSDWILLDVPRPDQHTISTRWPTKRSDHCQPRTPCRWLVVYSRLPYLTQDIDNIQVLATLHTLLSTAAKTSSRFDIHSSRFIKRLWRQQSPKTWSGAVYGAPLSLSDFRPYPYPGAGRRPRSPRASDVREHWWSSPLVLAVGRYFVVLGLAETRFLGCAAPRNGTVWSQSATSLVSCRYKHTSVRLSKIMC